MPSAVLGFSSELPWHCGIDLAEVELEGWFPLSGRIRALTDAATETALAMLPDLAEVSRCAVPDGNGALPKHVEVTGERFLVTDQMEATFAIPRSKNEVDAEAVRGVLRDACQAIGNPNHQLRVPLEAGIRALRVANEATQPSTFDCSRRLE